MFLGSVMCFFNFLVGDLFGGVLNGIFDGGFILSYGGVDQNCSVSALFEEGAETLQDKIQTLLFE